MTAHVMPWLAASRTHDIRHPMDPRAPRRTPLRARHAWWINRAAPRGASSTAPSV